MQRQEDTEGTGKGDPKVPGTSPSAKIVYDHHGPGPKGQCDRLSLSGAHRGRSRRHLANVSDGGTLALDPPKSGDAATGPVGTPLELPGYRVRDNDPMQSVYCVEVTERVQVDKRPRVEDGRLPHRGGRSRQGVPNLSA